VKHQATRNLATTVRREDPNSIVRTAEEKAAGLE